jgi:hypothetical protein
MMQTMHVPWIVDDELPAAEGTKMGALRTYVRLTHG